MFRSNDGAGENTNFLGPPLAGGYSLPPGTPNTFDLFAKYKIFTPFIIFYFTIIYLLSVLRNAFTRLFHKGNNLPKKLCMSPKKNDQGMTAIGWCSYQDTYPSQHFNSAEVTNVNEFKGKEKEKTQHVSKKNQKKGPVLYSLMDNQNRANLRLKYGHLFKGTNQSNNQKNIQLVEEDDEEDEEDDSDDDSDFDLEDDYYEDNYDSFDYDDGEDDTETFKERSRKMRRRVKKTIKKEVKKEVNKEVKDELKMEVRNELKEFFKNEMKKNLLEELMNEFKSKQMDTTKEGSENEQMDTTKEGSENEQPTLNQQIVQTILQDVITSQAQENTRLINPNSPKDLRQLNLELIDAENKHRKKKNEEELKVTQLRQAQEEINQIKKQIENVKYKRNIYVHPNEEYKQLLFLYPQNKMSQEEEKKGLIKELQRKYQIKMEQKQNLLKNMQKVQNEVQRAGDKVEALRASVKAKEEEENYKGKVNRPFDQHPSMETKEEAHLTNISHLSDLPQLPPAPSITSLPAQWKGTTVPARAERSPLPVKIRIL
ncbi:hypothetical protein PCYB_074310 [Plasmodium cynomolgi strain B]|uniref:Uncharacterized protein n=1 Tax=Plasmodium cynomolgi (strain B) TaxID=1120755 RepID=K6UUP3_PLACD|nr:hypothetical protein PCYB_074310 [Plasmodium cynomolgi strain B]GAB65930.1 hypothetical protein PCYB_074310 [Plasmodium cynomolgi strain B]